MAFVNMFNDRVEQFNLREENERLAELFSDEKLQEEAQWQAYSVKEISRLFSISEEEALKLMNCGLFKTYRVGNEYRASKKSVEENKKIVKAVLTYQDKKTMSVPDVMRILGLGKTATYRLLNQCRFKTYLVLGKMRVDVDSFEDWYGWAAYLPYKNELRLWDGVKITSGSGERVDFSDGGFLESNPYGILYYTPAGKTARELTITVSGSVTADPYAINILKSADADGTASARIVGWTGKGTDTLTTANYPFRNGAYTVENCTVNITGRIDVLTSLTLKNADVTATAPSASSYAINAANYSKTITVMGDSSLTLKGKGGGKAANLYPEPEYRAQQVLYPAYTTSVFLDATSPDGSNGAYAWTDPTTEPNWNDYQYISIRTQDENTPVGMVQFKLDGVPTVGETVPSVSVVDAYADYVDGEATEYAWWLVEDGRVVSQLLDWSTLQPGRTYRVYAYAVAADGYSFAEYTVNRFKICNEEGKVVDTPYGTIDGNRGDYANFYVEFTMPGEASAGVRVLGTATRFGSQTDDMTIQLIKSGESEAAYEAIVKGDATGYSIAGVLPGTYTMKVMKQNHVTREYEITVEGGDVELDVKIHLKGDINGDGVINIKDKRLIYYGIFQ